MTSPDPATSVNQQFWGRAFGSPPGGAPANAPNDAIILCEGADPADYSWAKNLGAGKTGWGWSWDLRGATLPFIHDFYRWLRPTDATDPLSADPTKPHGMRDSVNRQHLVAEQNNWMLRKLCAAVNISLTGMPGE